jgi:hypothetical protein
MIDPKFLSIIQKVVLDRGKAVIQNKAVFNSLLADYARGQFVRERRLFIRELSRKSYDEIMREAMPAPLPVPVPALPVPVLPAPVPAGPSMIPVKALKEYSMYDLNLPRRIYETLESEGLDTVYDALIKGPYYLEKKFVEVILTRVEKWLEKNNFQIDWEEAVQRLKRYQRRKAQEEEENNNYHPVQSSGGGDEDNILGAVVTGAAVGLGAAALLGALFS